MSENAAIKPSEFQEIIYFDIVKIHWKIQAIVHSSLGLPIAFLTVYSWGIPLPALLRLTLAYVDLYFFIYFPLYMLLPKIALYPVRNEIRKYNSRESFSDAELTRLITFLMNFPHKIAVITALVEFSAFAIGAWVWTTGIFVPELKPILNIALLETFILGLVVSINISFLNLVMVESYMRSIVEQIMTIYPQSVDFNLPVRRVSMYTKVFFLILLTTFAGEISIFIFFITYILSTNPDQFFQNAAFVACIIFINFLYLFILAPIVARNFTTPIHKLVDWVREISGGNLDSRIRFITNDETGDIIRGSNKMMDKLKGSREVIELEKNKLSTVLYGVIDGVIALDSRKRITLLNKAAEDITGWRYDEAIARNIDEVMLLTNDSGSDIRSAEYCKTSATDIPLSPRNSYPNLKLTTKKGRGKYITFTCSTISRKIGSDTTFILTFHDTTDEKQLENMKLDFVSMAAHELRTPVTVIKGYLDVFLQENKSVLNADQSKMLTRVFISSQQLSILIDSLLNVSKIEKKTMTLNKETVNWKEYVMEVVETYQYLVHQKKQKMECIIPSSFNAVIECDKVRAREILGNLISNAVNYTEEFGSIRIILEENPNDVITRVQDSGMGIPESAFPHLFTKFFRVSGSLEANAQGNGLGLYLSRAIVEMHGGKIWVESKIGVGSIFSFSLPKNLNIV